MPQRASSSGGPPTVVSSEVTGEAVSRASSGTHRIREEQLPVDDLHEVTGELGQGGMGTVVSAEHRSLRREVAMKILRDTDDKRLRLRFVEEARITGQLEHPNIVPVHDLGIDRASGQLFFTMKRVQGQTLEQLLDEVRAGRVVDRVQLPHLLRVFIGTCNAIGFAHSRGVVHRDIKPANIMTGTFGEVLVMDWGLAKPGAVRDADDGGEMASRVVKALEIDQLTGEAKPPERPQMTMDGEIVGTIPYMPPEQADGRIEDIDERSDIYALGAILYEILCLEPPVGGGDADALLDRVIDGDIEPPAAKAPIGRDVPADLAAISMKALKTDPDDRYQTVRELREDVQRFLEGRSVSAKEDGAWEMVRKLIKRNKQVSAAVAVALVIITTLVAVGYVINAEARRTAESSLASMREAQHAREEAEAARVTSDSRRDALIARIESDNQRSWFEAYRGDLSSDDEWHVTTGWGIVTTLAPAEQSEQLSFGPEGLHIHSDRNLGIALRRRFGDDLRVSYRATYGGGEDGGMHVTLGGSDWRSGYGFQVGGWRNTRCAITRSDPWGFGNTILDSTPYIVDSVDPVRIRATAQRRGGAMQLTLEVDGQVILETVDRNPLEPVLGTSGKVALLANGPAESRIHEFRVETLAAPRKVSLLQLARQQLSRGQYRTAIDLFAEAAAVESSVEARQAASEEGDLARSLLALEGDLDELQAGLQARWPDSQLGLKLVGAGLSVSISGGTHITDLEPLAELPVVDLRVEQCPLSDISVLADLPLRSLWLRQVPVYDLATIQGSTQLESVVYMPSDPDREHEPVPLSTFRQMPLRVLRLGMIADDDLSELRGKQLEDLSLGGERLRSLDGIQGMPLLSLGLLYTRLEHLGGVQGLPLRTLGIQHAPELRDISACSELPELRRLILTGSAIADLTPLAGMRLQRLRLGESAVVDLSPLADVPVESLDLSGTGVTDLGPVATSVLRHLDLRRSSVTDLGPLAGCRLESLAISHTAIADLEPLRGHPLARFEAADSAATDLAPLAEAELVTLLAPGTAIADLTPLAGQPLTFLDLAGASPAAAERIPDGLLRLLRLPQGVDDVVIQGLIDRNPGIRIVVGDEESLPFPRVLADSIFQ